MDFFYFIFCFLSSIATLAQPARQSHRLHYKLLYAQPRTSIDVVCSPALPVEIPSRRPRQETRPGTWESQGSAPSKAFSKKRTRAPDGVLSDGTASRLCRSPGAGLRRFSPKPRFFSPKPRRLRSPKPRRLLSPKPRLPASSCRRSRWSYDGDDSSSS